MLLYDAFDGQLEFQRTLSRSELYGDGLFETIAIYQGKPLWFSRHYQRLMRGIRTLKYELPEGFSETYLRTQCEQLIALNGITNGRIRIYISRQPGGYYQPTTQHAHWLVQTFPLDNLLQWNETGIKAGIFDAIPLFPTLLKSFKSCNSLVYVLAAQEARQFHWDDCILLSHEKKLAELTASNLFWVQNDKLFTPDVSTGCIPGILREVLMEIAEKNRIPVEKTNAPVETLLHATEIFATNVIHGIVPIRFVHTLSKTFSTQHNHFTRFLYEQLMNSIHS